MAGLPPIGADSARQRLNARKNRAQKQRRNKRKSALVEARGGSCEDCAYSACSAALEFHHRDPSTKGFSIGNFTGSHARLLSEAELCDLLCANCHRKRHADGRTTGDSHTVVKIRRRLKADAVAYMGEICFECGRQGPAVIFEFHHVEASQKDFEITSNGVVHPWEKIVAELEKCVMLCANCHREVHAGVRTIRPTLLGLAEDAAPYAA